MANLLPATSVDFEQLRLAMLLNKALYAMKDAGEIHKDFVSMPVIHTDSFELYQFSHVYPKFLQRGGEIVATSSKNKKDVYHVESHMYIAEGRFDIDAFRDSTYFTAMKNMITSQNAIQLQQVNEKRTIRKLFEALGYEPTLGSGTVYEFIEDNGDNSEDIAAAKLNDPLVVLEGAKWNPTVILSEGVTFAAGETSANLLTTDNVDGAVLAKEIIALRSAYEDRASKDLQKGSTAPISVLRVAPAVFDALRAEKDLGNRDVTSENTNLQTSYVNALSVGGFTVVKGTHAFSLYEQGDDQSVKASNLPVNMPNRKVAYTYDKTTFDTATNYVIAFAYTSDALVHADVMPIRMRTAREDLQQLSVMYFETSSDTFIINAGETMGILAPGV